MKEPRHHEPRQATSGCAACGGGDPPWFHWGLAQTSTLPRDRRDVSVYVNPRALRVGTLYECRTAVQTGPNAGVGVGSTALIRGPQGAVTFFVADASAWRSD